MLCRRIESLDAADVRYGVEHVDYRARHIAAGSFGPLSRRER